MFLRGETYKSSANVSSTIRPNIPKFLFKVKKGDQVQYNPPLRTIDLSNAHALPHFPKPAKRKKSVDGIIKRWSLKRSFKSRRRDSPTPANLSSSPHNFVKRWSLKRRSVKRKSSISSDWSATDEPEEEGLEELEEGVPCQARIRRWSVVTKQKSLPNTTGRKPPDSAVISEEIETDEKSVVKRRQSSSLRLRPVRETPASWRLSLQDAMSGDNKACVYLQDTGALSASQELQALKRTLSGAQFYKDNSALMFLFPEPDPAPTSRWGSLIRRTSSRKSQVERDEERKLKRWRKRFMGVNKKFVLKHLVSLLMF